MADDCLNLLRRRMRVHEMSLLLWHCQHHNLLLLLLLLLLIHCHRLLLRWIVIMVVDGDAAAVVLRARFINDGVAYSPRHLVLCLHPCCYPLLLLRVWRSW